VTTAADVLRYAADEVGYSRWDDALEGSKYGRWYAQQTHSAYFASSGVPFCAMFVSNILAEAGTSLLGNGQVYAYVPWMIRDARSVGRLVSPDDALPGDVLCFDWDGDGVADHTGFLAAAYPDYVATIEGNTSSGNGGSQSNGGGVYRRTRDWDDICAIIRPAYTGTGITPTATPNPVRSTNKDGTLVVDGWLGNDSIGRMQLLLGQSVDGYISGQDEENEDNLECFTAIEYDGGGSLLVEEVQRRLGVEADGILGPNTVKAWQGKLGVTVDGYAGVETGKAIQRELNAGRVCA
jgi:hypothetical protein bbifN4_04330